MWEISFVVKIKENYIMMKGEKQCQKMTMK